VVSFNFLITDDVVWFHSLFSSMSPRISVIVQDL
jgi:hypothetical protein